MSAPPTLDPEYDDWSQNTKRRSIPQEQSNDADIDLLPLSDPNSWYYPSHGYTSDEEEAHAGMKRGNWGNKTARGSRWLRRGKLAVWGPPMEDWEAEERARKRVKLLLLHQEKRSPSPPTLPHLARYSSFVMDRSVTHTFRSKLLDELESATNGLIEGEATVKRALGRLWEVISEDPDQSLEGQSVIPKREDEDDQDDNDSEERRRERRLARAPDLTPAAHKLFLTPYNNGNPPDLQFTTLEKALATLRELQDDGREGLGDIRAQRNGIWDVVRERAVKELQEAAMAAAGT
ncbi:hypothetical protein F5887DRAFT_944323, partial [Amanita rubescens]